MRGIENSTKNSNEKNTLERPKSNPAEKTKRQDKKYKLSETIRGIASNKDTLKETEHKGRTMRINIISNVLSVNICVKRRSL